MVYSSLCFTVIVLSDLWLSQLIIYSDAHILLPAVLLSDLNCSIEEYSHDMYQSITSHDIDPGMYLSQSL